MVFIKSTKGTPAIAHLNSWGAMLSTAPMRRPPAERPVVPSCDAVVTPDSIKCSAHDTKSVKVFFFLRYLPSSSYHVRPISPPPRMWAIAYKMPRSNSATRVGLNSGSMQAP